MPKKELLKKRKVNNDKLKKCPECTGKIRRLVSGGSGLIFKGSGFYLTDYAKKNSNDKKTEKPTKTEKKKTEKESTKS